MILSHKHKFIFIKTVKTAGTSIEVFLSQHCGPNDVLTPIRPPVEGHQAQNYEGYVSSIVDVFSQPFGPVSDLRHPFRKREKFYNHMPGWQIEKQVGPEIWNSYFKFCVDRNPWDKVLSHYHMNAARAGGALTLDEYLAKGKLPLNYPRYTDRSGERIIVDQVVRYENLMDQLGEIFARLNVPFEGVLGVTAKSEYRSDRTPYRTVLNDEQCRKIERIFAREIELHGYSF